MIVKFNNDEFSIGFSYEKHLTFLNDQGKVETLTLQGKDALSNATRTDDCVVEFNTYATIEKKLGKANYEPLVTGEATKHPKDSINKVKGRKIALTRALQSYDEYMNNGFKNISFRKTVWAEYFKVHKDGKLLNEDRKPKIG